MGNLVKCEDCGNPISAEALKCPHCGAPTLYAKQKSAKRFFAILGTILFWVVVSLYLCFK